MKTKFATVKKCFRLKAGILLLSLASVMSAGAKEFKTTLTKGVEITYLVNTTDKIARVKLVEEVGVNTPTKITIPQTVKYKEGSKTYTLTVTGIGESAFNTTWFKTVNLPSTIKTIGKSAFSHCSVEKCDLPDKLERIEEKAFMESNLKGVVNIPAGCTYIGKNAFTGTYISTVNFNDDGVFKPLVIDEFAFSVSNIETVALNRVSSLGEGLFSMCDRLKSLNISGPVTVIPRILCYGCTSLTQIGIPVVESIGEMAFARCESLREFPFMPGLKHIGNGAFQESGLNTARIKEGCETIEEEAFFSCKELHTVEFPASLKSIAHAAFQQCGKMASVSCEAITPPAMKDSSFTRYRESTIWVPKSSVDAYDWAEGWRNFDYSHLRESGIESISVGNCPERVLRYDLQGNPIPDGNDYKGIYIEIKDGKSQLKAS